MSQGAADEAATRAASAESGEATCDRPVTWLRWDAAWIWLFAMLFAAAAWWPLVLNPRSGLQGGDIYTYFFPLKAWYAERLRAGELPLWNPLIGHGVPALAESQTGVLYPFNLLFYRFLSVGAAYNANMLLHYMLAFGFTCHYARRIGLPLSAALLTGIVFVYGWFPARSCLEWAIVTGAWMPLALWGVEAFLADGRRWWLLLTQAALWMQLVAGHFNLAFITLVLLTLYVPLRLVTQRPSGWDTARRLFLVIIALALAGGLAAIQLVPSWELKGRSQRGSVEFGEQKIGYGSIPWSYLAQVFEPWRFYPHVNELEFDRRIFGDNNTNKVEAHLYFGLVPIVLAVCGVVAAALGSLGVARWPRAPVVWVWIIVGASCFSLVTGWWTRWAANVPGFGYFTGPGRYGVVVQLALGVLAGHGVKALCERIRAAVLRWPRLAWTAVLSGAAVVAFVTDCWTRWAGGFEEFAASLLPVRANLCTVAELGIAMLALSGLIVVVAVRRRAAALPAVVLVAFASWVDLTLANRFVQYAEIRSESPIHVREQSVVGGLLRYAQRDARVLARNQNAVSLCGVATVPPYLGIGPAEYFSGPLRPPADFHWQRTLSPTMRGWLEWSGITHVLAFEEMDDDSLETIWGGHDPFLHELLGRPPWEPLRLYRFRPARGRAYWVPADDAIEALNPGGDSPTRLTRSGDVRVFSNRVDFTVECDVDAVVVLTDLNYPGWKVLVDGHPSEDITESVFRAVRVGPGRHEIRWVFRPTSLLIGLVISLVSVAGTAAFIWVGRKAGVSHSKIHAAARAEI